MIFKRFNLIVLFLALTLGALTGCDMDMDGVPDDSDNCPAVLRAKAWDRIVGLLPTAKLEAMIDEATLDDLPILAGVMLEGRVSGRIVIDVNA